MSFERRFSEYLRPVLIYEGTTNPSFGTFPNPANKWVRDENDRGFIDCALRMDTTGLIRHAEENDSACSAGAAASAMVTCQAMGAERGNLIDYYTSYDIMPDESFVGYAGIVY